jgi:hypothetical protein
MSRIARGFGARTTGDERIVVFCTDEGLRFLAGLGYNVIRHPFAGLQPPTVIGGGRRGGECEWLGDLPSLIADSSATLPQADPPVDAADVKGSKSSSIDFGFGATVLASFIGALGGTLELSGTYTNAKTIQFLFKGAKKVQVAPSKVSDYIEAGRLRWQSPLYRPYLEGAGRLFIVTTVLTAKVVTVVYESGKGVGAAVKVPALQGLVDGDIDISANSERAHEITYAGERDVAFGFKCFEFGFKDGKPQMVGAKAGAQFLDLTGDASKDEPAILVTPEEPLLDLRRVV